MRELAKLPLNRSFFCCVDLGSRRYVTEQKASDVIEEEVLSVRIGEVETVVVDDLCLFLQPAAPARLADFRGNSLAQRVGEWCEWYSRALLAAMRAFDFCHASLLVALLELLQW